MAYIPLYVPLILGTIGIYIYNYIYAIIYHISYITLLMEPLVNNPIMGTISTSCGKALRFSFRKASAWDFTSQHDDFKGLKWDSTDKTREKCQCVPIKMVVLPT